MNVTALTVHVTKRALAHLLGKLDGALEATLGFGELACGEPSLLEASRSIDTWFRAMSSTQISVEAVDKWREGKPVRLPTCPRCAVLWDEAIQSQPQKPEIP
jgi:hypothetical protein